MLRELPPGVRWVHKDAYKLRPQFDKLPDDLPGKLVKASFYRSSKVPENMWVKVKEQYGNVLVGVLDNDPIIREELKCGDTVIVHVDEILEWREKE
jgi:Uncharacterized protein conserved in bacteria (DUF2314)